MTDHYTDPYPEPLPRVRAKVAERLGGWHRRFVELSPFVVMATGDGNGNHDASPRGGPPGFARVLDDTTVVLPDASGNNLFQTRRNLRADRGVGMLFLVPGLNETLRVNGSAEVVAEGDAGWPRLRDLWPDAEGYRGAVVVTVREAYYHCGRSVRFARLWDTGVIDRHRDDPPLPRRP